MAGKGDRPRPVDYKKYCENFDEIFRKKPQPKKEEKCKTGDKPSST